MIQFLLFNAGFLNLLFYVFAIGFVISLILEQFVLKSGNEPVKKLSNLYNFQVSISYTTRIPRINETNGKDYFFISEEDFKKLIIKKLIY